MCTWWWVLDRLATSVAAGGAVTSGAASLRGGACEAVAGAYRLPLSRGAWCLCGEGATCGARFVMPNTPPRALPAALTHNQAFKHLSMEPGTLHSLQRAGAIATLVPFLGQTTGGQQHNKVRTGADVCCAVCSCDWLE